MFFICSLRFWQCSQTVFPPFFILTLILLISFPPVLTQSLYYLKSVQRYEYKELRNGGWGVECVYWTEPKTTCRPHENQPNAYNMFTVWKETCLLVCAFAPASLQGVAGLWRFVFFYTYLINHTKLFFKHLFQLCRQAIISIFYIIKVIPGKNLVPQRLMRLPLPSEAGTYCLVPWKGSVCGPCEWERHLGRGGTKPS
jgi:hypothetical protein